MATYTYYWPQSACADARAAGLEGEALPVFFGGYNADSDFQRFKVGAGDTVIAISVDRGVLYLLASLRVEAKGLSGPWLADHPEHRRYGAARGGGQVLAGEPLAPLDFGRAVSPDLLARFRYDAGKTGRPIKYVEDGLIKRSASLQGVYRLTSETALSLAPLLERPPTTTKAKSPNVEALVARLHADPDDEATASVLADAWSAAGDVRGELLALEIALHRAGPAERAAIAQSISALASKRRCRPAHKQPGGFPFRRVWDRRDHFVWMVGAREPAPIRFRELEARLSSWAVITKVFREMPRRALTLEEARALRASAHVRAELQLLDPETGSLLPFQGRLHLPEASEIRLSSDGFVHLRCAIPALREGPTVSGIIGSARRTLPSAARDREQLAMIRYEGQVPTRITLPVT